MCYHLSGNFFSKCPRITLIAIPVDLHCQRIGGVCSGFLREPPPFFITQNMSQLQQMYITGSSYMGDMGVVNFESFGTISSEIFEMVKPPNKQDGFPLIPRLYPTRLGSSETR